MRNKVLVDTFNWNDSECLNNKHAAKHNLLSGFIFQLHAVQRKVRFVASQLFWEGIYRKYLLFFWGVW